MQIMDALKGSNNRGSKIPKHDLELVSWSQILTRGESKGLAPRDYSSWTWSRLVPRLLGGSSLRTRLDLERLLHMLVMKDILAESLTNY